MNAALIPIMSICTTDNVLGKIWLQRNFTQIQPYYQKYIRTCVINLNIYADDYHIRLLKRNIKEFHTLMQNIESGNYIACDENSILLPPPKKNKLNDDIKLQKQSLQNEISTSLSSNCLYKNSKINNNEIELNDIKIQCKNDCSENNNELFSGMNTKIIKPQKMMSITLQDEYGNVYNKKDTSTSLTSNRYKQINNSVDNKLGIKFDDENSNNHDNNVNVANKSKKDNDYQTIKELEKCNTNDVKITKILKPNRLKQGETFSSVLQQNLNKEKCVAVTLKRSSKYI